MVVWQAKPYGVKKGLLPVLTLAYTLSRRDQIAFYRQGVFQSRLTDLDVDYLVQDPGAIQLRWLDLNDMSQRLLLGMAEIVREFDPTRSCIALEPLDVARALVATYELLDPWTKRTTRLGPNAVQIRNVFKQASDPHRFLFDDLPNLLGGQDALKTDDGITAAVQTVRAGLSELRNSYHTMLSNIETLLMRELHASADSPDNLASLRARAENIRQVSGDLQFNAFIARLAQYQGTDRDIEGLVSLAVNKPPREWTDPDLDQASLELAKFAQQFIQTEAFARVKGRSDKRHAMAVVVGLHGQPTPVSHEFLVADEDRDEVHSLTWASASRGATSSPAKSSTRAKPTACACSRMSPPLEELDGAVNALLGHLVVGGREAHAKIKDLVRTVAAGAVDDAMIADTAKRIAEIRVSPEGREGIASFLEKRKPAWVKDFEAVRVKPPRKKK